MSNVKKRLNRLRKKSPEKKDKAADPAASNSEKTTEGAAISPAPSSVIRSPGKLPTVAPEKKATLDKLRSLISTVQKKTPENSVLEALNRKPLARHEPVRDHAPGPGAGLLEPDLFEGPGQSIEDLIPGEHIETPHGQCFRVRTEYPWQYHQGAVPVSSLLDQKPDILERITGDPILGQMDFHKTLFFDTETTGLDTGAGVYIFMAGLGFYENRTFVVEQYFMRDFPEEPAVLHAMADRMEQFQYVVTFNGKTYDWPLLESRYAMNRRSVPLDNPPHFDLLHISRRLYRFRLENCKLPSVEAGVLQFHRIDDMPGALLPEKYFNYVRSRDARFIHKAFAHNSHDIVSMAAIMSAMIQFLETAQLTDLHPVEDVYALGRFYESAGAWDDAEMLLNAALKKGLGSDLYADALQRLSLIMKRQQKYDRACEIWHSMVQTTTGKSGIFARIELAKHFEHRQHDLKEARTWALSALEAYLTCWPSPPGGRKELEHRLKRIETRLAGGKWTVVEPEE